MQSQGRLSKVGLKEDVKQFIGNKWGSLSDEQKKLAKKFWNVITYKWRWQIALNILYLAIFVLDKTIPSVHEFDMYLLAILTSNIPIPSFLASWLGLS